MNKWKLMMGFGLVMVLAVVYVTTRAQPTMPIWILNPISDSSAQYFCIDFHNGRELNPEKCRDLTMDAGGGIDDPESNYCTKNSTTRVLNCNRPFWVNQPQWNGSRWVMPAEQK